MKILTRIVWTISFLFAISISYLIHSKIFVNWEEEILIDSTMPEYIFYNMPHTIEAIATYLALRLSISYLQAKEIIYLFCDIIAIFIIFYTIKYIGRFYNHQSLQALFALLASLYFLFYPYGNIGGRGFIALYVLMTIIASLIVFYLIYFKTIFIYSKDKVQKNKNYIIFNTLLALLIVLVYLLFSEDPRIFLYPLLLVTPITVIVLIIQRISNIKIMSVISFFILPIFIIILMYLFGIAKMKVFENIRPYIPLTINAFAVTTSKTELYNLLSGISWVPLEYNKWVYTLVMSVLLFFGLILYLLFLEVSGKKLQKKFIIEVSLILYLILLITLYIKIGSYSMIVNILKFIFNNDIFYYILNNTKFGLYLKNILLMLRVPRILDFTIKIIFTYFIIILPLLIFEMRNKRKNLILILSIFIIVFIIVSEFALLYPIISKTVSQGTEVFYPNSMRIDDNFPIKDSAKTKIVYEAFFREKIISPSLLLINKYILINSKKYYHSTKILCNDYNFTCMRLQTYYIIKSPYDYLIGEPILIKQGLLHGSSLWKKYGFIPIYLDSELGNKIFNIIGNIPLYVENHEDFINIVLNIITNSKKHDTIILLPSQWCKDFSPIRNVWSPGFIGDPHHGIFYEPEGYEYDYTFKLNYGVAQCSNYCNKPLRILFNVPSTDQYYIFMRLMHIGGGKLEIKIDDQTVNILNLTTTYNKNSIGFKWVKVILTNLTKGMHELNLIYKGQMMKKSYLYINVIVLVRKNSFEDEIRNISLKINKISSQSSVESSFKEKVNTLKVYAYVDRIHGKAKFDIKNNSNKNLVVMLPVIYGKHVDVNLKGCSDFMLIPTDYVLTGILLMNCSENVYIDVSWYNTTIPPKTKKYIIISTIVIVLGMLIYRKF